MSAELVTELEARTTTRTRVRARVLALLGPVTAAAGIVWALAQPYRITLLHPSGQGFWWLVIEPPLLVVGVGLVFHRFVAPGLLDDLDAEER